MSDVTHEVGPDSAAPVAEQYTPSVYIEVSKEQLELLEVGNTVTMKLTGKVKGLSADEMHKGSDRYEIRMEMQTVKIDPKENAFTELAEDD